MNIDSMSAFVKVTLPINDAIIATESSRKFIWPQAARDSQESVIAKMNNTPKVYTHLDRSWTNHTHCFNLVMVTHVLSVVVSSRSLCLTPQTLRWI